MLVLWRHRIGASAFGSTDEAVLSVWVVALGGTLLLSVPLSPTRAQISFVACASIVAIAWAGLLFIQTTALAPIVGRFGDHVWPLAAGLLDQPLAPRVSVVRDQPFYAVAPQIVAALSLSCGFILGEKRSSAWLILSVVAWSGAVYGAYAIVSFIWDPATVLWREKVAYRSVLTGTFINRNTAAVYFGACALLWLLRLLRSISGSSFRVQQHQLSELIRSGGSYQVIVNFAVFILLLSATFMTGSRAGSLLFIFVTFSILTWAFEGTGRSSTWYTLAGGTALFAALMAIVGAGIAGRVAVEGLVDSARLSVYRSVLRLISDHPWWGAGLGTFASIFPAYRPSDISSFGIWDRAHSTPLELAAEQGIPFTLLVTLAVGVIFAVLINGVRNRREGRIFPLASIALLSLAMLHSLIDFSLQIPGLTIVVLGLVGAGLAQCPAKRRVRCVIKGK
ncbi:O-antigen ligase family protein [Bradyrhizobium sp. RDM12]